MRDFWVFGYGSLIWNPGFTYAERKRARLHGLHRSLCIYSWVHRGTKQKPGLVLGLDRGGSCVGMAMRASGKDRQSIIDYLRERELVTSVYLECWRTITIDGGERVPALLYRVDQTSPQYAGNLPPDHQARIVRDAKGESGHNVDYVQSTVAAMQREGIRDTSLEYVAGKLERFETRSGRDNAVSS